MQNTQCASTAFHTLWLLEHESEFIFWHQKSLLGLLLA